MPKQRLGGSPRRDSSSPMIHMEEGNGGFDGDATAREYGDSSFAKPAQLDLPLGDAPKFRASQTRSTNFISRADNKAETLKQLEGLSLENYVDEKIDVRSVMYGSLAFQSLFAQPKWQVFWAIVAIVGFVTNALDILRVDFEPGCPDLQGVKHPERVGWDFNMWAERVPYMLRYGIMIVATTYFGLILPLFEKRSSSSSSSSSSSCFGLPSCCCTGLPAWCCCSCFDGAEDKDKNPDSLNAEEEGEEWEGGGEASTFGSETSPQPSSGGGRISLSTSRGQVLRWAFQVPFFLNAVWYLLAGLYYVAVTGPALSVSEQERTCQIRRDPRTGEFEYAWAGRAIFLLIFGTWYFFLACLSTQYVNRHLPQGHLAFFLYMSLRGLELMVWGIVTFEEAQYFGFFLYVWQGLSHWVVYAWLWHGRNELMADTNDSLRKQRIKYDEAVVEAHPDIWRVEDVQHHDSAGGGGGGGGGEAGAERAPLLRRTTSGMNAGAAIAGAAAEGLSSGVCGVEGTYCQVVLRLPQAKAKAKADSSGSGARKKNWAAESGQRGSSSDNGGRLARSRSVGGGGGGGGGGAAARHSASIASATNGDVAALHLMRNSSRGVHPQHQQHQPRSFNNIVYGEEGAVKSSHEKRDNGGSSDDEEVKVTLTGEWIKVAGQDAPRLALCLAGYKERESLGSGCLGVGQLHVHTRLEVREHLSRLCLEMNRKLWVRPATRERNWQPEGASAAGTGGRKKAGKKSKHLFEKDADKVKRRQALTGSAQQAAIAAGPLVVVQSDWNQKTGKSGRFKTLLNLYTRAFEVLPAFDDLVKDLAQNTGGEYLHCPIKSPERSCEKLRRAYHDDIGRVCDLVRGTVVFDDLHGVVKCMERIRSLCVTVDRKGAGIFASTSSSSDSVSGRGLQVLRVKNRYSADHFDASGYRDVTLLLILDAHDGFVCELQLNLKSVYDAKAAGGHKDYRTLRDLRGN